MSRANIKKLKPLLIYTAVVFVASLVYFIYFSITGAAQPDEETFLSEIGEGLGGLGLGTLVLIYGRTALKLALGKGGLASRIIPESYDDLALPFLKKILKMLNKTHVHVGIASVALIVLHAVFMGLQNQNLLLYLVFALVIWQAFFGFFLSWRYSPKELRKVSYLVHAQFLSGIMIGIFAFFGHLLVKD